MLYIESWDFQYIFGTINIISIIARMVLSILLGGILGLERENKNRAAGFRTYILVCLGSTLIMMTNQFIYQNYESTDPARLGAQVVSGIGFLGAGAIMVTNRNRVKGLTTAAGLWVSACLGLSIGIGFYSGAIMGGVGVLFVLSILHRVDDKIRTNSKIITLYIQLKEVRHISSFISCLHDQEYVVDEMSMNKGQILGDDNIALIVTLKNKTKKNHTDVISELSNVDGIEYIGEL